MSGSKSGSCSVSSSSSKKSAQGRAVCEYVYAACKLTIPDRWAPEVLPVGAGGMPGGGGVSSGVHTLPRAGGGAPVPLCLQHVCGFFAVPFWQERQPDVWLWRSIAGCLCIAAFTFLCSGKFNTPRVLFSDLGVWFLDAIFHFFYCGAWKAFFGHFGHIQRQAHVGLFQLYPTSLPCHSCRHVENLQDISWCF